MTSICRRRLLKDYKKFSSETTDGIMAAPNPENIMLWDAVVYGYQSKS